MPSLPRPGLAELKSSIVARVLAGEGLRAICREPWMPCCETVRHWRAADAAFGVAMADALRRGPWMRLYRFDEAKAAAFLARARAGEAINGLIGAEGMPSRATYRYWCATQGAFAEAVGALRARRDAGIGAHGRARYRAFDRAAGDRVIVALNKGLPAGLTLEQVLAADPALPSRPVLTRWRRENPGFDRVLRAMFAGWRRYGKPRTFRVPELERTAICEHIAMGGSFASYCREGPDGAGGPSRTTLRTWYRRDEAFAAEVDAACEWRDFRLSDEAFAVAMAVAERPGATVRAMNRAVGPLRRQIVRLRHRPGAVHRRRDEDDPEADWPA